MSFSPFFNLVLTVSCKLPKDWWDGVGKGGVGKGGGYCTVHMSNMYCTIAYTYILYITLQTCIIFLYSGTCVTVTWIKRSPLHNGHGHEVPNIFPYKCMQCGLH